MVDFFMIATRPGKRGIIEIYPKFIIKKSSDLMIRGGDFYAVWLEDDKKWSTDEQDVIHLIDSELDKYAKENRDSFDAKVKVLHMWDAETGIIDKWHNYCKKQMRDNFHPVDRDLIFSNHTPDKSDYATKSLPYPLEEGEHPSWNKLISTLYSPEERHKIEWGIGSIVTGDSKFIQKCFVLYGDPGTGKSTIFNIMQNLFEGYWTTFEARALGSASNIFAMDAFRTNPRVAINHDGDLSRIEDNTRLNSIISHENMKMQEKFKSSYDTQLDTILWIGTNKPVKITDAKSGLIRRIIDVSPTGDKLPRAEYKKIIAQINFELGAIAYHCKEVYLENPSAYDDYVPLNMLSATNDFYNFIFDNYLLFEKEDGVSLKAAWEMYNLYCEDSKVQYPLVKRIFKEELKNYFRVFNDRYILDDGTRIRSYYSGFISDKFSVTKIPDPNTKPKSVDVPLHMRFDSTSSTFDEDCADCIAQYANDKGTPTNYWENVTTKLSDLDTTKLHYVRVPENHIVIDFDIPDKDGKKNFEKNLEAASSWPSTYAELSKSGAGIHLHYIYSGDVTKLSRVYDDHVEIKVFTGNSSLRRKLSKCNNLPIATISSGLPLKEEIKKMINSEVIKSEKGLRTLIKRSINKEIHPATKPSIDFIYKILNDAYNSGLNYDVTDMRNEVLAFAANSTNQSTYCIKLVNKMQFKSLEASEPVKYEDDGKKVFYDIEVFPNLLIVNWKLEGPNNPVVRMINPEASQLAELTRFKLIGFNCRKYDNHIVYGRMMGYSLKECYELSQRIIVEKDPRAFFGEAYNISYLDLYDVASNDNRMSLKMWEIKLGIHHQELDLDWNKPVPEHLWEKVAAYCDNDVIATEAVYNHPSIKADITGREILAAIAGGTVNDTTNSLTAKFIFGNNRKPQNQFNYRDLGSIVESEEYYTFVEEPGDSWVPANPPFEKYETDDGVPVSYELFDKKGRPHFPGYKFEYGKSSYRDVEVVGEGGRVYANQGIYYNVALLDVASMHPSSAIAEELFGPVYTAKFKEIVDARIAVKHKDWDTARRMLDGKLAPFIDRILNGEISAKDLAYALKIAINSVYGLTSAKFENRFKDLRNKDNIVAKRGSLFMINLQHAVEDRGYTVVHIKTDSIKIADADDYIIDFVCKYGEMYGYTFEHEATYDRMCIVNDAVYIAKYSDDTAINGEEAGKWTATGTQFQVPYVFKTLFSKEPIVFDDLCEIKNVNVGKIYMDMNKGLPDVSEYEEVINLRKSKKKKTKREEALLAKYEGMDTVDIYEKTKEGHNYIFVGKVGQFCPVSEDSGGGKLCCVQDDMSVSAVTGTKDYTWMETEMVKTLGKEDCVDKTYYTDLVNKAVGAISQYGDFEAFAAN